MDVVSKCGIHSIGDKRDGYGPFLLRVAAANRRVSLIKCRDDFGAVDEPLALWPETVTVGAHTLWDDSRYSVDEAYKKITALAKLNPKIKYWEYFNERNGEWREQTDLYIALMPRLADAGIGLCMYNAGKGTPQYPEIDPVPYAEVARACQFAKQRNYKAILGLHEYPGDSGEEADLIGRYKRLADYLQAHDALIPIAITEWGWETTDDCEKYLAWVKHADPVYMGDPRVIGCALYTLGGRGWQGSNYRAMLPDLGEYIATVQPAAPVPTPQPPPAPITIEDRVAALERRVTELERKP